MFLKHFYVLLVYINQHCESKRIFIAPIFRKPFIFECVLTQSRLYIVYRCRKETCLKLVEVKNCEGNSTLIPSCLGEHHAWISSCKICKIRPYLGPKFRGLGSQHTVLSLLYANNTRISSLLVQTHSYLCFVSFEVFRMHYELNLTFWANLAPRFGLFYETVLRVLYVNINNMSQMFVETYLYMVLISLCVFRDRCFWNIAFWTIFGFPDKNFLVLVTYNFYFAAWKWSQIVLIVSKNVCWTMYYSTFTFCLYLGSAISRGWLNLF